MSVSGENIQTVSVGSAEYTQRRRNTLGGQVYGSVLMYKTSLCVQYLYMNEQTIIMSYLDVCSLQ